MKIKFILFFCLLFSLSAYTQTNFWSDIAVNQMLLPAQTKTQSSAWNYRSLQLDMEGLNAALRNAPMQYTIQARQNPMTLLLPMPNDKMEAFTLVESPVMEPELAAKYPFIKTYKGQGVNNRAASVRLGITQKGFHATILSPQGTVYIDPYAENQDEYYISYFVKDNINPELWASFECGVEHKERKPIYDDVQLNQEGDAELNFRGPDTEPVIMRNYRLAMSCTGEYTSFHGGTVAGALSAMVIKVNRLNQVFERDLAMHVNLVANNDTLIFLDGSTDPFTNGSPGELYLENPPVVGQRIGAPNYDYGHVLGTHGSFGGIAFIESFCTSSTNSPNFKAGAASTINSPQGDPFVIDIIAHEMGHQMGANHSFNSCHNVEPSTAYEPGGGTTIMSYSGICFDPVNNLQFFSDDNYHAISLQEIFNHVRFGGARNCGEQIPTSNTEPSVEIPISGGFYIPISTPFELDAVGTDAEGDAITYSWEQFNLGPVLSEPGSPQENSPIFRAFPPTPESNRIFPKLSKIINNNFDRSEVLPTYSRDLTFRCVVRDNNPQGGGTVWDEISFQATASAGPFKVLNPSSDTTVWKVGDYTEVVWDVANTDNDTVNCQYVNIRLSLDGGFTYPILLAENTLNDGSAFVTVPDTLTDKARVKIEASQNIFFDISNNNFDIEPATEPGFTLEVSPVNNLQVCLPAIAEYTISTSSILGYDSLITLNLLGDLPTTATYEFSSNPVMPSEAITLTIDLGAFISDTFNLQIEVIAPGIDTSYRDVGFISFTNDFSELAQLIPEDGTADVILSTDFTWTEVADAESYDIQIATSPAFGASIVDSETGIPGTNYTPSILFEDNTLYYWRIRPVNACGPGEFLTPFVFHTANTACSPFQADDVPINVSGTGTPTVESTIFIPTEGIISDLNIPFFKGSYQPVNSIRLSLISPMGTEVNLFDQNCGNTINLLLGFDDAAPSEIVCPPDDGIVNQPVEPLATFIGENTQGNWTLRMKVVETGFGGGGALEDWRLEFCASIVPNSPFLVTNEILETPPNLENTITKTVLEVQDEDNAPDELEYTLVTVPQNGFLLYLGNILNVGDTFRQSTINANNLKYQHDGSDTDTDSFIFTVTDGTGGFLAPTQFNIIIDEDATVDTDELYTGADVILFPNPTSNELNLQFTKPIDQEVQINVQNVQGQVISSYRFNSVFEKIQLHTDNLTDGIYFISIQSDKMLLTKKVIIQR